jgi:hypothetical protein
MTGRNRLGKHALANRLMGKTGNRPDNATAGSDAKSQPARGVAQLGQFGRRLSLSFVGFDKPRLQKVEFRYSDSCKVAACGEGLTRYFGWTAVPQALSLLCLDYVYFASRNPHKKFVFQGANTGSMAASLGNAKYVNASFIHELFVQLPLTGGTIPCLNNVIDGINLAGKDPGPRYIIIDSDFLPPDCIHIFEEGILQTRPTQIKALKDELRHSLSLPIEAEEPAEVSPAEEPTESKESPGRKRDSAPKTASGLFSQEPPFGEQGTGLPLQPLSRCGGRKN